MRLAALRQAAGQGRIEDRVDDVGRDRRTTARRTAAANSCRVAREPVVVGDVVAGMNQERPMGARSRPVTVVSPSILPSGRVVRVSALARARSRG